jgi:uncharacterized protein (DUF58 family)
MRPTLRSVLLAAAGIPLGVLPATVEPRLWALWLAWMVATITLLGADAIFTLPRRRLRLAAVAPDELYIGKSGTLVVTAVAPGVARGARAQLRVELDRDFAAPEPVEVLLGPEPARVEIPLVPRRRGDLAVRRLHLRWRGPLGLSERVIAHPVDARVAVVPDVGTVREVALQLFIGRELLFGQKALRYVGEGSDFESLREYVPGLDHRAIDWKASARHTKLLTQEFRAERNHQVVLAVDSGQLMGEPLAGVSKLDHAVNAALLLAYVSLRAGDRVGFLGFDERVRSWAEPAGGVRAFPRLRRLTAELDQRPRESNYTLALAELSTRLRRRSLVVLITDFLDTITAELMVENVLRLARRHLVLFVTLADPSVAARAEAAPRRLEDLHEAVVAADFARERSVVLERLRRASVHCVEAPPGQVSTRVVNRYLEIKRRELL